MTLISVLILALALSIDAFSVSLTVGMCGNSISTYHKLRYYTIIGLFHVFMMFIGWYGGSWIVKFLSEYDHWISFVLLSYLGLKMIKDGVGADSDEDVDPNRYTTLTKTFMFGFALSVDAIVAGVTLSAEKIDIISSQSQTINAIIASVITGITAFLITWLGVSVGCKTGKYLGRYSTIIGGFVLIFLGTRVLFEHL